MRTLDVPAHDVNCRLAHVQAGRVVSGQALAHACACGVKGVGGAQVAVEVRTSVHRWAGGSGSAMLRERGTQPLRHFVRQRCLAHLTQVGHTSQQAAGRVQMQPIICAQAAQSGTTPAPFLGHSSRTAGLSGCLQAVKQRNAHLQQRRPQAMWRQAGLHPHLALAAGARWRRWLALRARGWGWRWGRLWRSRLRFEGASSGEGRGGSWSWGRWRGARLRWWQRRLQQRWWRWHSGWLARRPGTRRPLEHCSAVPPPQSA